MADAKDCPLCGLINPPDAARCDCGYDFVARQLKSSFIPGAPSGCHTCGAEGETKYVEFHQNIGLVIFRLHSSVKGRLCRPCIGRHFWGMTGVTLILGWWGVISFVCTPFILLNNVVRYLSCLGMATPAARATGSGHGSSPTDTYRQLVGQICTICERRISSDLDGRFCKGCASPVHNRCVRPGSGTGCPSCGNIFPDRTPAG